MKGKKTDFIKHRNSEVRIRDIFWLICTGILSKARLEANFWERRLWSHLKLFSCKIVSSICHHLWNSEQIRRLVFSQNIWGIWREARMNSEKVNNNTQGKAENPYFSLGRGGTRSPKVISPHVEHRMSSQRTQNYFLTKSSSEVFDL